MKRAKNYLVMAAGILLFGAGLCFLKTVGQPDAFMRALPYVCIGIGSGMLGHGLANVISAGMWRRDPAMARQKEINSRDERNIAITNRAKAKAYDLMVFLFAALMIAFLLLGVDMVPILLLVCAYLYVQGYAAYCHYKYGREM